jgi:hypothetical protein
MATMLRCAAILTGIILLPACGEPARTSGTAASTAEVACEDGATRVVTPVVRAQVDGVHVDVDNRTGAEVYVYRRIDSDVGNLGAAAPGTTRAVSLDGPGSWEVICTRPNRYPTEDDDWVPLEVVDPDGLWISDRVDCERPTATHPDYREDFEGGTPEGAPGDPVDLAREDVGGGGGDLHPNDVFERAGYPESRPVFVRMVRDDRIVAVATYAEDGRGGWIFRGVTYCED